MATMIVTVDRQSGNYEQVFIYTINASFNGIAGEIQSAQIRVFVPDYLDVFLGDAREPVKSVEEIPIAGGREVVYDFGAITDLGIAVRLGFGVTFKTEATNGMTFLCNPKLFVNGAEAISSVSDEIALLLEAQFEITRNIVLPTALPSAGSAVFYELTLQNFGDLGAVADNIEIVCAGSDLLMLDNEFSVVGADDSTKFADKTQDGIEATFEGNSLRFSIPTYRGEIYRFIYRAVIADTAEVGTEIATLATWSIDSEAQPNELHEVTLSDPIYDSTVSIYAPDYSLPNEYLCYRMNIKNTGNQILTGVLFENDLPPDISYYRFNTGSFNIGVINQNLSAEYFIDYETFGGVTGQLGPFNTDVNTAVDLTTVIPDGDNLSILFWRLNTLGIGVETKGTPQLLGIVNSGVPLDSSVVNHIHLSFDEGGEVTEVVENATTLIANYCALNPSLSMSVGENPVKPGQELQYTFHLNCRASRVQNPIFALLMPRELEYVGAEQYSYSDIFTATTPPQPQVRLIPNFGENGETLVKFEFRDENAFSFRQLATAKITFTARVAVGALGEIESFLLLNTKGSNGIIPNTVDIYVDSDNIAEDSTVQRNYAKSNVMENRILYFVSTSSNKKVKGLLDSEYVEEPIVGRTVNGGSLEYLITVKNIGNAVLDEVEIVDILPYIGDTGVIVTGSARGSEFPLYALSEVVAVIQPSGEEAPFEIFYSTSADPVRFGANFDVIGTDDNWTVEPPEDLSELKSFKVRTRDRSLSPSESLMVAITATVPTGVQIAEVAWNSFAADVVYTDLSGTKQHLAAIEPEKVGIQVADSTSGTVKISGYSWVDSSGDGYRGDDEPFVNDVAVVLYNEEGVQLRYTSTTTDIDGNDGQYVFENLEPGRYYVKFFIDSTKLKFTAQRTDTENGSKADKNSGTTPIIDLTTATERSDINVGILPKGQRTLQEILAVNRQARGMVRDVIKTQMLLTMRSEDVLEILESGSIV